MYLLHMLNPQDNNINHNHKRCGKTFVPDLGENGHALGDGDGAACPILPFCHFGHVYTHPCSA